MSEVIINPKIADIRTIAPCHAHVIIEPLERGFGHTLGNALRRVMMAAIPGFAVTEVKIDGIVHEYDRIEGLREDVVWLLLNLKKIVFKIEDGDEATLTLGKSGAGAVTAGDIDLPHNVTILNPDLVLGTLTAKGRLNMEMIVRKGVGYEPVAARERDKEGKRFGAIPVDAQFSPVRRVAFHVDNARVANRTDLDRLVMDMETNGVYDFQELVRMSADILIRQLSVFAAADEDKEIAGAGAAAGGDGEGNPLLSEEVEKMGLTARSQNCLRQMNIRYIGDLVKRDEKELMKTPRLGRKSLMEIKQVLDKMNLALGMTVENWTPPARG